MNHSLRLIILLLLVSTQTHAQRLRKADKAIIENLKLHISYLADDRLEGRRAGTEGEKLAREYISEQFQKIGLTPKGENNSYLQPFEINDGQQVNSTSLFIINGYDLKLNTDYFPLVYSPDASLEAAVSMALKERNVPWFYDIKELLEENKDNPHYDLEEAIKTKAKQVADKGANALIIYNSSVIEDGLKFNGKDRSEKLPIPVLYLNKKAFQKYLNDEMAILDIRIKTAIGEKIRTGHNVVGFLNNNAPTTIIIGAHYDHLGYGEDGNSMLRTGEKLIHNGADDNASGTAAVIELARLLKDSKKSNENNYLFIAFSGEELGLNGSKYYTEHATIDMGKVNYMMNLDMVGRLYEKEKTVTIGGYGTSPVWGGLMASFRKNKYLNFKYDSSGTGPSDHTSFYRKDIPVLFFFTGLHSDYHKPTDDYDKINYVGELLIIKYIEDIINASGKEGKLAFTKTREVQTTTSARFSVSLGIMPDYTYSGAGIRVDGVTDDRPAKKAGIQTGDVIVQLGEHSTNSLESYMQALSKFKKGDKTKVKYKRGDNVIEGDIQF